MSSNENQNYNLSFQHLKGGSFEGWTVNDLKGQINSLKILVVKTCWNGFEIFCLRRIYTYVWENWQFWIKEIVTKTSKYDDIDDNDDGDDSDSDDGDDHD